MSDYISRQAAIDGIYAVFAKSLARQKAEEVIRNLPSAQPELIEQAAYVRGFEQGRTQGMIDAQPERRWIPCSERLPEVGKLVLTADEHSTYRVLYRDEFDCWFTIDCGFENVWVKAWMPLPEPYKGGEEDG